MAFPIFAPGINPSTGSGYSVKARVISNNFGDGYRQVYKDGLNAVPRSFSVTWNSLPTALADVIENFFKTFLGQPFYFKGPRDTGYWKYDCLAWDRKAITGANDTISATFNQRFDHDPDPNAPATGGEGIYGI